MGTSKIMAQSRGIEPSEFDLVIDLPPIKMIDANT